MQAMKHTSLIMKAKTQFTDNAGNDTHFTDNETWQLVDKPMTQLAFEAQAFIKPRFFELNIKMLSEKHGVIICEAGELELCFQLDSSQASKQEFKLLFGFLYLNPVHLNVTTVVLLELWLLRLGF